jgi:adhesin/invasin
MISRGRFAALFLLPTIAFVIELACSRVPLLAPSGSSITLTTATSVVPLNGTATIVAQVIESAGTAPQAGTHVTFSTSLGTIQPSDSTTNSSGQAMATFTSTSSGTATITAISGGAGTGSSGALKILVGSAAVQKIVANASPATVPAQGGSTTIQATVFDVNGNLMTGIPVTFTTTAGVLSDTVLNTNAAGMVSTTLTTAQTATVTASVGVGGSSTTAPTTPTTPTNPTNPTTPTTPTTPTAPPSASGQATATVLVNISGAPTIVITPPTTSPTAGQPSNFTFAVTPATSNGSAIKNLNIDWNDGSTQDLGGVSGSAVISHTFPKDGTFVVTATVTDAAGNIVKVSTVVFVQVAPPLAISLSTSQSTTGTNTVVTATATVTGLGTAVVQNFQWVWGDGTTPDNTTSNVNTHTYVAGSGAKTLTVTITTSTGAQASASRAITP